MSGGVRQFAPVIGARAVGAGAVFGFNVVVGRAIGAEAAGDVVASVGALTLAATIGVTGLDEVITRIAATADGRQAASSIAAGGLAALTLGAVTALALGTLGIVTGVGPSLTRPVLWSIPLLSLTYFLAGVLRGFGKVSLFQLLRSAVVPGVAVVLLGALLVSGSGISRSTSLVVYAFSAASAVLIGGAAVRAVAPCVTPRPEPLRVLVGRAPDLVGAGYPIMVAGVGLFLLGWLDVFVADWWLPGRDAGVYIFAARTAALFVLVANAIGNAIAPDLARAAFGEDRAVWVHLQRRAARWTAMCTTPLALELLVFSEEVLAVYGNEFREGGLVLRILVLAHWVTAPLQVATTSLVMSDHGAIYRRSTVWTVVILAAVTGGLAPVMTPALLASVVAGGWCAWRVTLWRQSHRISHSWVR